MAGTLPEQKTWHQELDLLTRFHSNNNSLGLVKEKEELMGANLNKAHNVEKQTSARVKSIERGSKVSNQDDGFIARQIESTKSEISLGKDSSQLAISPKKVRDDQRVSTRPKLIKKNSSSSEGKWDSGNSYNDVKSLGRGRGRKVESSAVELPVGAVANMIQQNVGQGHRLEFGQSRWIKQGHEQSYVSQNNNNVNSSSYFPKFDYCQYNIMNKPAWWAASSSGVGAYDTNHLNSQAKKKEEKVLVKRAVLTNWTPLDDSV